MGHLHSKSSEWSESSYHFLSHIWTDHYVGSVSKFSSNWRNSITRPTNLPVRWAIIFKISYLNKCPFMYWLWAKFHPKKVELDFFFFKILWVTETFMKEEIPERRDRKQKNIKVQEQCTCRNRQTKGQPSRAMPCRAGPGLKLKKPPLKALNFCQFLGAPNFPNFFSPYNI